MPAAKYQRSLNQLDSLPDELHHSQHKEEVWRELVDRSLLQGAVCCKWVHPAAKEGTLTSLVHQCRTTNRVEFQISNAWSHSKSWNRNKNKSKNNKNETTTTVRTINNKEYNNNKRNNNNNMINSKCDQTICFGSVIIVIIGALVLLFP